MCWDFMMMNWDYNKKCGVELNGEGMVAEAKIVLLQ